MLLCRVLLLILCFVKLHSSRHRKSNRKIKVECKDNDNKHVDWWYVMKTPGDLPPHNIIGSNFSYVTSESPARWEPSLVKHITWNSMLQYTLSPRHSDEAEVAYLMYDARPASEQDSGTAAIGLLMADTKGGIWLTHTVPGYPNTSREWDIFPPEELYNGHLFACMSFDLVMMDLIASQIQLVRPIIKSYIPDSLKILFSSWLKPALGTPLNQPLTTREGLEVLVMARPPGDMWCVYKKFAKSMALVLDVYGHSKSDYLSIICTKEYGVRNIERISVKFPYEVMYIKDYQTDRTRFAVSTAAHWQTLGAARVPQYWVCTTNLDKDHNADKGGLLICVHDYQIWINFDTLKVKEPSC